MVGKNKQLLTDWRIYHLIKLIKDMIELIKECLKVSYRPKHLTDEERQAYIDEYKENHPYWQELERYEECEDDD